MALQDHKIARCIVQGINGVVVVNGGGARTIAQVGRSSSKPRSICTANKKKKKKRALTAKTLKETRWVIDCAMRQAGAMRRAHQ
jgi:hypothetical protein